MVCWKCGCEVEIPISPKDQEKLENEYCGTEEIERIFKAKETKRIFCEKCKEEKQTEYENKVAKYRQLRSEIMFERALKLIEKQKINMYDFKDAISVVEDFIRRNNEKLFTDEWESVKCFDSADEIAAAIILLNNKIHIQIQKKIAGSVVDFCLPNLKVILEIDGELFHKGKSLKESRRDTKIRSELGREWEIVRIPTAYIHQNIKMLPEAIKAIKEEKQKLRSLNGGFIPKGFSKQDDCIINKIEKILT